MRVGMILLPWWTWHAVEEFRSIWELMDSFVLLIHILSYILPLILAWILRRYMQQGVANQSAEKRFKWVTAVVIVALLFNTWNIVHGSNRLAARRAASRVEEASTFAENQLNNSNRKTSALIIVDQAITKIMEQVYVMLRSDFPELRVRAITLHMLLEEHYLDSIWNVVQAGEEAKEIELLYRNNPKDPKSPGSLAFAAIKLGRRVYCSDLVSAPLPGGDCSFYQNVSPHGPPPYSAIACFPVKGGAPQEVVFAAVCILGEKNVSWEGRLDEVGQDLDTSLRLLAARLTNYRSQEDKLVE